MMCLIGLRPQCVILSLTLTPIVHPWCAIQSLFIRSSLSYGLSFHYGLSHLFLTRLLWCLVWIPHKKEWKKGMKKKWKKLKWNRKKANKMKFGMISIPLRHELLVASLWDNIATEKACFLCYYVNNVIYVSQVGLSLILVNFSSRMMIHLHMNTGIDSKSWCTVGWNNSTLMSFMGREPWRVHFVYMYANIFATWVI